MRARLSLMTAALLAMPLTAALADTTAAPAHTARRHHAIPQARIAPLPATPKAPIYSPTRWVDGELTRAAPVPNPDITAPSEPTSTRAQTAPRVFSMHYPPQGNGYPYGSSPQALDDAEASNIPGVQLRQPLQ